MVTRIWLFPNVIKLEEDYFGRYRETLQKINYEIYEWPMNIRLKAKDQILPRSLVLSSDLKKSQSDQTIGCNSKGIVSQEKLLKILKIKILYCLVKS